MLSLTFHRSHRHRTVSASIGTLALTLVALAVPNATASAAGPLPSVIPGTTSAAATASQIPTASQPVSAWQAWASAQTKAIESVPWMQMFQEAGCTLNRLAYETVPADIGELGAPAGVYMTSVGGSATCPNGTFPAFLNQPATVSGNPPKHAAGDPCRTITGPGSDCVGPFTYYGTPNYISASYKNKSSHNIAGHEELSIVPFTDQINSICHYGSSALANSPGTTPIKPSGVVFAAWGPRNASNTFDGTFWYDSGYPSRGPYHDYGTECAAL